MNLEGDVAKEVISTSRNPPESNTSQEMAIFSSDLEDAELSAEQSVDEASALSKRPALGVTVLCEDPTTNIAGAGEDKMETENFFSAKPPRKFCNVIKIV